jgi:hypothetical protein
VFLRAFVVVARPAEEVGGEIAQGAERWLPDIAKAANGDGEKLLSELGFKLANRRIGRRIEVEVGQATAAAGIIIMPIHWHAASEAALFPTLDGVLEIAELGHTRTQLGISANYKPPLGLVGKIADRALFHRVAEVTVTDFLKRVGARLERK